MKLVSYKNYVAGWLDSTIHDLLSELSPDSSSMSYMLITCIDSDPKPASLRLKSPELKLMAKHSTPLGTGLLLPTDAALDVCMRKQLFFGFDEVWFFPEKPVKPKPDGIPLVGPSRIDHRRLKHLGKWLLATSCSLGLGGGEGLNFVIQATGLAKNLLGHSIRQPQASMAIDSASVV